MSEYGRAWESHRVERENHKDMVKALMNCDLSKPDDLSVLIKQLQFIEQTWRNDEKRLRQIPG